MSRSAMAVERAGLGEPHGERRGGDLAGYAPLASTARSSSQLATPVDSPCATPRGADTSAATPSTSPRFLSPREVVVVAGESGHRGDRPADQEGDPRWAFVEDGWFLCVSASMIVLSVLIMAMEVDNPVYTDACFWPDQAILAFFLIELCSRMARYRHRFFFGDTGFVLWNSIDFVVVFTGVVGQWLLPLTGGNRSTLLQCCRVFRIFRVARLARVVLSTDLAWTEQSPFQTFVGVVIALNAVQMGIETDFSFAGWRIIEQIFLVIYVFELTVRMKHGGWMFISWQNNDIAWNVLDSVIVLSSIVDSWMIPFWTALWRGGHRGHEGDGDGDHVGLSVSQLMMMMRMLRLMRILRIVRIIKAVRPLYVLVTGVLCALQGVGWVLVLTLTVLYCLGILATRLIGHGLMFGKSNQQARIALEEVPFRSVPESMFTLFRIMSGAASDAEVEALDSLMSDCPFVKLCFVLVMIATSWTLLSILTAVVSENMISSTRKQDEEQMNACAEELRRSTTDTLTQLFLMADTGGNGIVEEKELQDFCDQRENALQVARTCQVPVKDVKDILKSLHDLYDHDPQLDDFVECLVDVGRIATEKSLLRIEARIEGLQRKTASDIENAVFQLVTHMREEVDRSLNRIVEGQAQENVQLFDLSRAMGCCRQELEHLHQEFEDDSARRRAEAAEGADALLESIVALHAVVASMEMRGRRAEAAEGAENCGGITSTAKSVVREPKQDAAIAPPQGGEHIVLAAPPGNYCLPRASEIESDDRLSNGTAQVASGCSIEDVSTNVPTPPPMPAARMSASQIAGQRGDP